MKKIISYLNLVKTIKKYIMIKKIERYSKGKWNNAAIILIDILILALLGFAVYYIYFVNKDKYYMIGTIIAACLYVIYKIVKMTIKVSSYEKKHNGIKRIILLNSNGVREKQWNIEGKTALLIGRSTKSNEVDIDLSSSEYASLISKQHAILNFAADDWYIEDLDSSNGVGIKNINNDSKQKLEKNKPYKLKSGDTIYIANTVLVVE